MRAAHSRRNALRVVLIGGFSLLVFLIAPFIGPRALLPGDVFTDDPVISQIFWQIRVPRVTTAFVAGAVLALSGMVFQALFRNPLATPYILGVSTGASLGAAVYILSGISFSLLGFSGTALASFAGAMVAISFVYGLSQLHRGMSSASLLLAGVAVNFFFSSLIMLVQYMGSFYDTFKILRWLMGGLEVLGYRSVLEMLPVALIGGAVVLAFSHEMNQLASGEELARGRGVNVTLVKNVLFIVTSLLVGAVVAICGPIGFVGMMAPHICKLIVGSDHRLLAPASMLFGGAFLALCDSIARVLFAPAELPVGIITAFLGGPFFIWLLLRRPGRGIH